MKIDESTLVFRLSYRLSRKIEDRILDQVGDELFFDAKQIEESISWHVGKIKDPVRFDVWDPFNEDDDWLSELE